MYVLFTSKQMRGRKCMQLHQKCSKITAIVRNTHTNNDIVIAEVSFLRVSVPQFQFFVRFVSLCISWSFTTNTNKSISFIWLFNMALCQCYCCCSSFWIRFSHFFSLLLFILILLFVNYNVLFSTFVLSRKIIIVSFKWLN